MTLSLLLPGTGCLVPGPGWTLVVHGRVRFTGTLKYGLDDDVVCQVELTPAKTALFLALAACRAIDEREGRTGKLGCRCMEDLAWLVAAVPGPGNPVTAATIGGYKRRITRDIRKALESLSDAVGRQLDAPMPILNLGWGQGYCLADEGLELKGISIDELVESVLRVETGRLHRI